MSIHDILFFVNRQIREAVRQLIKDGGMNQTTFGERVGLSQSYVSNLLSGKTGTLPESWGVVLDELDLELYVRPKSTKKDIE